MPLTTLNKIREHTAKSLEICNKVFTYQLEAEELLIAWIGQGKYDEIEADTSHTYYARAQKAESLLCYMYALPMLNLRADEKGGHVKNTGFSDSINDIMGKRELDSYGRNTKARARILIRDLILPSYRQNRPLYDDAVTP